MKLRLRALRSLRWNYKRRGVWVWLKGRTCFNCGGKGKVIMCTLHIPSLLGTGSGSFEKELRTCSRCNGKPKRGYQRILSEPGNVLAEQEATAEGVFV